MDIMPGIIRTLGGVNGSNMVDQRVGDAYWVVNEVYKNLAYIKQVSKSFNEFSINAATAIAAKDKAEIDAIQTAADRVQTALDVITTTTQVELAEAQVALATAQAVLTAADRVQTGLDAIATAADRVQTGIDATATAADVITTANNVETSNTNITTANNLLAASLVSASYATIALGLAGVATNEVFLVQPNVTDSLTRFTWYTKTGASTYTLLASVVSGSELDSTGLANLIAKILPLPLEVLAEGMRFRIGNRLYADFSAATGFTFHKINIAATNTFLSDLPTIALSERIFNGPLGSMISSLLTEVSPEGIRYRIGNRLYVQLDAIDGLTVHKAKLSASKTYLDDQPTVAIADRIFGDALGTMFNSLADELGGVMRVRWANRLLYEWDMTYGFKPSKAMLPTSTVLADSPTTPLVSRLAPSVDITTIYAWGDSRTAGAGDSLPYRFPEFLAALVSPMTSVNKGIGGQTSIMISARQGGWPLLLSVTGNTIPASGAVTVTAYSTDIFNSSGTPLTAGSHVGTLAGIAGTYTSDGLGGLTFTRTTAGTETVIEKYSPFIPDAGSNNRNKINFICVGTNNAGTDNITGAVGSTYDNVRYCRAMVDYVLSGGGLPIVAGAIDNVPTGTANTVDCTTLNNMYKSIFGRYYVDFITPPTAEELATANAAIGTTYSFTSNDNLDIVAGKWPRGLYADSVHFLRHGQYIQALRVQRHLIRLGIIT